MARTSTCCSAATAWNGCSTGSHKRPHRNDFVLKGATLFAVWADTPHRPTKDLDLLGFGTPSADRLVRIFRELAVLNVELDGLTFDADSVEVGLIRAENAYGGFRVRLLALLGKARVPLQVDVGFGDAITPGPVEAQVGPLLDLPAPVLRAYPPETVVAEKLEAIVTLGLDNTRMKDYFDLWTLARTMGFEFDRLHAAVGATFERRQTALPDQTPVGLSKAFGDDDIKRRQWAGFLRKMKASSSTSAAPDLADVIITVREFLLPILNTAGAESAAGEWPPGGPWRSS